MRVTLHIMRCWYLNIKNNFVSLQKDIIMGEKFKYPWNMRIYSPNVFQKIPLQLQNFFI